MLHGGCSLCAANSGLQEMSHHLFFSKLSVTWLQPPSLLSPLEIQSTVIILLFSFSQTVLLFIPVPKGLRDLLRTSGDFCWSWLHFGYHKWVAVSLLLLLPSGHGHPSQWLIWALKYHAALPLTSCPLLAVLWVSSPHNYEGLYLLILE